jgi:hypothetical protein
MLRRNNMLRRNIISFIALAMFFIVFAPAVSFARWVGPKEVLSGKWGKGETEFGFEHGDTRDAFPSLLVIDELGNIIIGDSLNKRIKIYNSAGSLQKYFSYKSISPEFGWPANLRAKAGVGFFSLYEKLQKYDYDGNFIWAIDVPGAMDFWVSNDGGIWLQDYVNINTYYLYSPTGQLLKTYASSPPELGKVEEKYISPGQYKVTVTYPDRTWSYIGAGVAPPYIRDVNGNLYSTGGTQAIRWNFCGKELARVTMPPKNIIKKESDIPGREPKITVLEQYGEAVVAPNGDVYTWKRTPDKYSIVKWTWKDEPGSNDDCPAENSRK